MYQYQCPYNQIDEVNMVSPNSLKRYVSVLVVELALGGSALNKAKEGDM